MAVKAVKPYKGEAKDTVEHFHGMQLLYIGWDDHKMFVAPFAFVFPPTMRFGDICAQVLPGAFGYHPDWKQVDLSKAQWFKSGQPWTPDMGKTIAELGLKHKDALRFVTPGLKGLEGSSY